MMKLKTIVFFPALLFALQPNTIQTQIAFSGEPMAAIKAIMQGFNAVGYKFEVNALSLENSYGELHGSAVGIKPLSVGVLGENLAEEGIVLESSGLEKGVLTLRLNTENAVWNAPLIGSDEGAELQRASSAQWFRVQSGQTIRMEPPYVGKWYPDIAVLDASMRVLYSFRSPKAKDELELELPDGAYYLKVSNVWGMKVLKEGMWIESITPGR